MRAVLLSLAGIAAASLPVHAAGFDDSGPALSSYIEGFGGYSWYNLTERDSSHTVDATEKSQGGVFGGAARAAFGMGGDWGGQADAWVQRNNFGGRLCSPPGTCEADPHFQQVWGVALHVDHHTPGAPMLGALVSFGSNANTIDHSTRFVNLAGEGQYSIGPLTFYAQAGYVDAVAGALDGQSTHAWYVHAELQYFKNQETLFAGNLGYARYDIGNVSVVTGRSANMLRWGARAEYKFSLKSPVSVFVSYAGGKVDAPYTYNGTRYRDAIIDTTVLLGAHWWFMDGSLQLNERTGPGLVDWNPVFGKDVVLY